MCTYGLHMVYSLLYLVNSVISAVLSASKKKAQVFVIVVVCFFFPHRSFNHNALNFDLILVDTINTFIDYSSFYMFIDAIIKLIHQNKMQFIMPEYGPSVLFATILPFIHFQVFLLVLSVNCQVTLKLFCSILIFLPRKVKFLVSYMYVLH